MSILLIDPTKKLQQITYLIENKESILCDDLLNAIDLLNKNKFELIINHIDEESSNEQDLYLLLKKLERISNNTVVVIIATYQNLKKYIIPMNSTHQTPFLFIVKPLIRENLIIFLKHLKTNQYIKNIKTVR